jgi:hypothetical protein
MRGKIILSKIVKKNCLPEFRKGQGFPKKDAGGPKKRDLNFKYPN